MKNAELLKEYKDYSIDIEVGVELFGVLCNGEVEVSVYNLLEEDDIFYMVADRLGITNTIDTDDAKTFLPIYDYVEAHLKELCEEIDDNILYKVSQQNDEKFYDRCIEH